MTKIVLAVGLVSYEVEADSTKVFRDPINNVTFRYPTNWKPVEAQHDSTKLLLYATDGSEGTATFSVVKSDRSKVRDFDIKYFQSGLSSAYKDGEIKTVRYINVFGQEMAIADAEFIAVTPSESFTGKALTMATIHGRNRFMIIVNGIPEKFSSPSAAFDLIVSTFAFLNR